MAFEVERGLDETPTAVLLGIHAARGGGEQGGSLIVFIEHQDKMRGRLTVLIAELVDALDCLKEDAVVEPVRVVVGGACGLLDPDIENEAIERCDLVEQPVSEPSELYISGHVRGGVEAGPLLFP